MDKFAMIVGYVFIILFGGFGSLAFAAYIVTLLIDCILRHLHAHAAFTKWYLARKEG